MTIAASTQAGEIRQWRLRRFRFRLFRLLCVVAALFATAEILRPYMFLTWNITESLPGHVFVVSTVSSIRQGDIVAFQPPSNSYYPREMRFMKRMIGVPGDVITHKGREVFLNGVSIGKALERDSAGRRDLKMINDGIIPNGYYFVWTPHEKSYDSRYAEIGLVSNAQIIGRATRLF